MAFLWAGVGKGGKLNIGKSQDANLKSVTFTMRLLPNFVMAASKSLPCIKLLQSEEEEMVD